MRSRRRPDPRVCSIDAALKIIGEKWSLLALREISMGSTRFDDIVHNTGAPRDILSTRLRNLEAAGVITRELYESRPARYEYHLAAAGAQLADLFYVIRDWGDRFARDDPENIVNFRHECGERLVPAVHCSACGNAIEADSVVADRDVRRSQVTSSEASVASSQS